MRKKKKSYKVELKEIRDNLQRLIEFPDESYPRRTEDGYPSEIFYDKFAYERLAETYRDAIRQILDTNDECV